jgi:hypothetical protein
LSQPILFGSLDTVEWLAKHDERLLTDIAVYNEQVAAICE